MLGYRLPSRRADVTVPALKRNQKPSPPRYRPDKERGTATNFPGFGPARIEDAYKELTSGGFAFWMRLMVASDEELKSGRVNLGAVTGRSQAAIDRVLLELSRKGYISFIRNGGFRPTEVVIERRAVITGRGRFVRTA